MNKTRVYLFTGFLESGKSSFIQDTLLEQGFGEDEKTLIIACEEGEVAFDIPGLEKENASVEFIENEEDLNYETLLHLHQKYQPTQVMIEYNGMWDNTKFVDEICIDQWQVVQILTTISAETFDLYYNNMRGQFVYHITGSDLVIVNRCDENTKKYSRFQYGAAQIDDLTGEQLTCDNILIQYSYVTTYEGTSYKDIETITDRDGNSGGRGKYITRGKAINVTWQKDSPWGVTHYITDDNQEVQLNPGTTWVEIVQDDRVDDISYQ